ncbi:MAG: flavodoxin family protein [Clostridia bacterium]|jgi:multimeric flavodoxin WrbA|nr:flavodoxin family protein [Clostridia bacterium]
MRVIAINGSHRKGKNTAKMLQAVLEELAATGVDTELVELGDYNIKHCTSCNKCFLKSECSIQDDDMAKTLGHKLMAADGIILGSPVYWDNVSTLMKNFMDRTRWMHIKKNMLAGKIGAAVAHAGARNGGQERCISIIEVFLKSQGLLLADSRDHNSMIINGGPAGTMFESYDGEKATFKRSVEEDLLAIQSCRQLGKNMMELLERLKR